MAQVFVDSSLACLVLSSYRDFAAWIPACTILGTCHVVVRQDPVSGEPNIETHLIDLVFDYFF